MPVQTSGEKPPLFFVHGLRGIMPLGPTFARILGPDQPCYAVNASGIDGRVPAIDTLPEMVRAYLEEIRGIRPAGPVRIGGMCEGTLAAIEIARELLQDGRQIGPVILADPPPRPPAYYRHNMEVDPRQPLLAGQLYQQVRIRLLEHATQPYNEVPFDTHDPNQVHVATLAGLGSLIALGKHFPTPFLGPAELIISAHGAAAFFHPEMPWRKLLPGSRVVHVLPWSHEELFRSGRHAVARLLKFALDKALPVEMSADDQWNRRLRGLASQS